MTFATENRTPTGPSERPRLLPGLIIASVVAVPLLLAGVYIWGEYNQSAAMAMQDTATAWLVDGVADRVILAVAVLAIPGLAVAILVVLARQRRADEAAAVQANLRAVVDAVPASINAKDRDGRCTFINYGQATFRGLDVYDAIGKTPSEAYGDEYKPWHNDEHHEKIFEDGRSVPQFEESFPDDDGAVSQVVTISLDITSRKHA